MKFVSRRSLSILPGAARKLSRRPLRPGGGRTPASDAPGALTVPRVTQEFFPIVSGPAKQALAISRYLERHGIASPVITTTPGAHPAPEGVSVRRFRPLLAAPNFRVAPALQHYLMTCDASVFHIHGWRNPVSDGAILAARRRRIPVVLQAHGIAFGHRYAQEAPAIRAARRVYDRLIRRLVIETADVVVASTTAEAAELQEYGFPDPRIAVIPIGVDEAFFAVERRPSEHLRLRLLTVGRLGPLRNIEQIIQALAILRAWQVPVELRVVGPGVVLAAGERDDYISRLKALAEQLCVADLITFTGPRLGPGLLEEYARADVFVYTSRYENFGQAIAEAAAAGLPIVATCVGVAADLLSSKKAGFLVPHGDALATAVVLRRLCESRALCRAAGEAAGMYAARRFDWGRIAPQYAELYTKLVGMRDLQLRHQAQREHYDE